MIPPSITMVIYAIMTEQSVGQILIAGIIPGILTALVYMSGVSLLVRFNPRLAPPVTESVTWGERWRALSRVWPIVILIVLVLGGIYSGYFPPSAAGAAGAFGALIFAIIFRRGIKGWLGKALHEAAFISCLIFVILIGGLMLSRMLAINGVIDHMVGTITAFADTPLKFLILVSIMYIILGCFLDRRGIRWGRVGDVFGWGWEGSEGVENIENHIFKKCPGVFVQRWGHRSMCF